MNVERMVSDYFEGVLPSAPMKLGDTYTEKEMIRHALHCAYYVLSCMRCGQCVKWRDDPVDARHRMCRHFEVPTDWHLDGCLRFEEVEL